MKRLCTTIAAALAVAAATAATQPPAQPYGDADGDGLSDAAEWLIGNVFTNLSGTAGISATNAYSLTALIPDYYRRSGSLYLGEMFADHDFMEDGWEDGYRAPARRRYDPWDDPDDDGWSNYAECRAGTDPGSAASRPVPTLRATVVMGPGEGELGGKVVFEAYGTSPRNPSGRAEAAWTVETGGVARAEFRVAARGIRGGRHVIAAWLDKNGDGKWNPGEPYGAAIGVEVGWSDAEFTVELTKTTPIMARFDLPTAFSGGGTDRDEVNAPTGYERNEESQYPGTNMPTKLSLTRVRVFRKWFNGRYASNDVVFDKMFDMSVHPALTEADLLADGKLVLDWNIIFAFGSSGVTNATYSIVIGDDELNNLPVLFTNRFEDKPRQTLTVPDPKLAGIEYAGRPTFRWSHTNTIDKAYPAFILRIYKSDKTTVVYDSGVQRAPARDSNGMYEWTAPVYAGMVTSSNHVFEAANTYYWAASMLDSKFCFYNYNEPKTPFRLGTSGNLLDGKEYGSIAVRVKYFGPLIRFSVDPTNSKTNLVCVQAFTSPDFSGLPVAETYVTNVQTIAYSSSIATNAVIRGVACGGTYYVRAFIDTDADGVKSDWESWGYNCFVLDPAVEYVWTPKPIEVPYDATEPPVATVFIEDADTDNDGFPDAWEMYTHGNLTTQGPVTGNTFYPTVNPSLSPTLNN